MRLGNRWHFEDIDLSDFSTSVLEVLNGNINEDNLQDYLTLKIKRVGSDLLPEVDDNYDLGSATLQWKDLYIDGLAYIDKLGESLDVNSKGLLNVGSLTASANLDIGSYDLHALSFTSDVATGTAPLVVASTTLVSNLNADKADGYDFDQSLLTTDSPSFSTLALSIATGTAPLTISSTTLVSNLNADLWDGYQFADYLDQAVKATSSPTFAGFTSQKDGSSYTQLGSFLDPNATGLPYFTVGKANADNSAFIMGYNSADNYGALWIWGDSAEYGRGLVVADGGKIGIWTTTPNSYFQVAGAIATTVTTKTVSYTATISDSVLLGDASGGAFTFTLPTAVGIAGREYVFKKIDSSANAVTIDGDGTETIDGATTYDLTSQYQFIRIVSDGANWLIIGS